jgi:hypothetical protein
MLPQWQLPSIRILSPWLDATRRRCSMGQARHAIGVLDARLL